MTQQNLSKIVGYATQQKQLSENLSKIVGYATEFDTYGDVFQDSAPAQPLYRDAPSGGVPYVDMSVSGAELKVNILNADTYTMILFKDDQTFEVTQIELTNGENVLPVTSNFNQMGVFRGKLGRITIRSIQEGMKARV